MVYRQTFGRRADVLSQAAQSERSPIRLPDRPWAGIAQTHRPVSPPALAGVAADLPSVDEELQKWKAERKNKLPIPWRQLSLIAGLCFGIASFALPDSVNDVMQWPLYALMAMSFYAGLRKR